MTQNMTQGNGAAPMGGRAPSPADDIVQAAKSPLTSARAFFMLSQAPKTSVFVAQNRLAPGHILDRLSHHKDPVVFCAVAENPSTPQATLRGLHDRAMAERNARCRELIAGNPSTPRDLLLALSCDKSNRIRVLAKKNIATLKRSGPTPDAVESLELSRDELLLYVKSRDILPRWIVASLVGAPSWALGQLSMDNDEAVVLAVARNKEAPPHVLELLSYSESALIRFAVASHGWTPPKTLEKLASDAEPLVRLAAESGLHSPENPGPTSGGAGELGADEGGEDQHPTPPTTHSSGIGAVSKNLPPPIEYFIQAAKSPLTSTKAFSLLSRLPRTAILVAQNRMTPDHILDQLSHHKDPAISCAVAENPSTPPATLRALHTAAISEPSPPHAVRCCEMIASNPSTPGDLLQLLARNDNDRIRVRAEKNIETLKVVGQAAGVSENFALGEPPILRDAVCWVDRLHRWAMASRVSVPSWVLNQLSADSDEAVVLAVAGNGGTSPGVLELLSHSKNALIRFSVASHKHAAAQTLARLASDADPLIRRAAAHNQHATKNQNTPDADNASWAGAKEEGVATPRYAHDPE